MVEVFQSKKTVREHLINLTKELIRFPSHYEEPLKIMELIEFIKNYYANDDLYIAEHVVNGFPALVITTQETKHPHIMMSGHIDVVPSSNQYIAQIRGDKMFGSGAMDMKGGVASMMAVMKYFAHQENPPSIGLMLTSDEEVGGETTHNLLNTEGYMADFCIVSEGRHKYDIVTREKGFLSLKLTMKGESMHSAYPWKAPNMLEELMKSVLAIKAEFPQPKDDWIPTVSTVFLEGGHEINTIPGEAVAILSFRLTGGRKWNHEYVHELIKKHAPDAHIEELINSDVFQVDLENPGIKLLKQVAGDVTGKRVGFGQNNGASDARFFMGRNIPTAVLGPVGRNHHTIDEHVEVDSIIDHFNVIKTFIEEERRIFHEESELLAKGH